MRALVQAAQAHRHLLAEEDVLVRVEALDGTEAGRLRPAVHQPAEVGAGGINTNIHQCWGTVTF